MKLGYNELGCKRKLGYNEHILSQICHFSTQTNPVITNTGPGPFVTTEFKCNSMMSLPSLFNQILESTFVQGIVSFQQLNHKIIRHQAVNLS